MRKAERAVSLGITADIVIALIMTVGFGVYLTFGTTSSTSSCVKYSCVHFSIDSNSPIMGISVALVPESPQCALATDGICLPTGPQCKAPSNFCSTINSLTSTDAFTFQGVGQGYYWLELNANSGSNGSTGTGTSIHVENQTIYFVTANITAGLSTAKIGITNTTS